MAAYTVSPGWRPVDQMGLNQPIDATSTVQLEPLGKRVRCKDTASTGYGYGEFVYLTGVASTVAGSVVYMTGGYGTALVAARSIGTIAVACSANVANQYGWYQTRGKAMMAVGAVSGAASPMYITTGGVAYETAEAGSVGDTIEGARSVTAADTSTAIVNLGVHATASDYDGA
jgi:hypothetical protein